MLAAGAPGTEEVDAYLVGIDGDLQFLPARSSATVIVEVWILPWASVSGTL